MADNCLAIWKNDEALRSEMQKLGKQGVKRSEIVNFLHTSLNIRGALIAVYVIFNYTTTIKKSLQGHWFQYNNL